MKKIILLPALMLCAAFLFAQGTVEGPGMKFEQEMLDYGTIEQNSDPFRVFSFVNNGNEPLVIKQAKGSCGCTVPTFPDKPVMPGEKAEIKVRYDTRRIGKFRKTVTLVTNATPPTTVLTIFGEVKKPAPEPEGVPSNSQDPFNN
jgi:hypothetical protein